jgi:hypothetical protein
VVYEGVGTMGGSAGVAGAYKAAEGEMRMLDARLRARRDWPDGGSETYASVGHDVRDAGQVCCVDSPAHLVRGVQADDVPNWRIS